MNPFERKSIFIHKVYTIEGGNPEKIAALLKSGGFNCVMPKVADGIAVYKPLTIVPNVDKKFVDVMHQNGIAVIGWGFNYGWGDGEGRVAAEQVSKLGLDGYIFDVESTFERKPNAIALAGQLLGTYRKTAKALGVNVPLGFCSWAFWRGLNGSQLHNIELAKFFMNFELIAYGMPMIYWNKIINNNPVRMSEEEVTYYYDRTIKGWSEVNIQAKPLIPIGRAYTGDSGFIDGGNILSFSADVNQRHKGISWWFLDHAYKSIEAWEALKLSNDAPFDIPVPPIEIPNPEPPAPPAVPNLYRVGVAGWSVLHGGLLKPPSGGPLTQYLSRVPQKGDNLLVLNTAWQAYIKKWNSPKAWEKISAKDFGPSFGFNTKGYLKYLGLVYPGNNVVKVTKIVQGAGGPWGMIETIRSIPPNDIEINPTKTPWLFHTVYGSSKDGSTYTELKLKIIVPIIGSTWYVPMSILEKI